MPLLARSPIASAAGLPLEPLGTESLANRIADSLVEAVAAGVIEPGQRLIEAEIAAALKVSRVPLREALKLLEAQGILTVAPRRGSFVVRFDERRVGQICEARLALERLALRTAVAAFQGSGAPMLGALDGLIVEMRQQAERGAWIAVSKVDLAFHRLIVAASGNDVVAMLWEALARHVLIVFGREIRHERDARRLEADHGMLRDLLADGAADAVDREIERHIMRLSPPGR
jgi:DNA-binding GntR family transcriptional regulator